MGEYDTVLPVRRLLIHARLGAIVQQLRPPLNAKLESTVLLAQHLLFHARQGAIAQTFWPSDAQQEGSLRQLGRLPTLRVLCARKESIKPKPAKLLVSFVQRRLDK